MQIRTVPNGEHHELLVSGRVDGTLANQLEVEILTALRQGARHIYVNLAEANFLCSAGLRVLLQYWRQAKKDGKTLVVVSPSPEVDSVLDMSGFRAALVEGAAPK